MKNLIQITAAGFALAWAATSMASEADRLYLRDRLSLRYVDQPNSSDPSYSPAVLDNAAILGGAETGAFWGNASVGRLQELVRGLLKPVAQGGDDSLQFFTARVIRILDKPVIVYLLDDSAGPITASATTRWGACALANRAWPCAINMSIADDFAQECARRRSVPVPGRNDATWAGQMNLGTFHLSSGAFAGPAGKRRAYGVFLHELVHTQDRSDARHHIFWVNGRLHSYGGDGTHFTVELMPNRAMTYKEGIANSISLLFDASEANSYFQWFASDGVACVEKASAPPGSGPGSGFLCHDTFAPSPDVWLFNQISAVQPPIPQLPSPAGIGPNYACFRLRSLPPRMIVHNEFVLGLILSKYATYLGTDRYLTALKNANDRLFRVSSSGTAALFQVLCQAGLPSGATARSELARVSSGPQPYLLPLAFADYFTGFRSQSKEEFGRVFEGMLASEWLDLYWDGARSVVRSGLGTGTPQHNDLTTIATRLGMTQSR